MFKVKFGQKQHRLEDGLRNLLYPLVPVIAVATIWTLAWAKSVESRMTAECGPIRSESEQSWLSVSYPEAVRLPPGPTRSVIAADGD